MVGDESNPTRLDIKYSWKRWLHSRGEMIIQSILKILLVIDYKCDMDYANYSRRHETANNVQYVSDRKLF